ncbi:AmmeMemoRadiSam system radical SAM enzyme [candidate division WOR-3 bacterium]|nr:AmmeMemoRadiSam system radical SAM enzyme [candidate division WOR-3 bacterium]MCK4527338.1 AmmeMemoRadiSam system radical SAM enzyme [candidate division WOR-3 bacterium]
MKRKADYYEVVEDNILRCTLCPHKCVIPPGKEGICWGKENENGILYSSNYGKTTSLAVDPIEKKPLFHFRPGTKIISVSPNGCNMKCPYCQNYTISARKTQTQFIEPENLVNLALQYETPSIAFTYSEPIIWFEYIMDVARFAKQENIDLIMVTNGLICEEPLMELLRVISAMNVDLKSMNEDYYKKVLSGDLKTTQRTISIASKEIHIEVTNLLILGDNDSDVEELSKWLSSIDKTIPLHISRYFPYLGYDRPPTPISTLKEAYDTAKQYLHYVYIGNAPIAGAENTYCPECSNLLIERSGYSTTIVGIKEGRCNKCSRRVDIVL